MQMKGKITGKTELSPRAFKNMVGLELIQVMMKNNFDYKGKILLTVMDAYEKHAVDLKRQGKKEMVEIFKAAFHKENELEARKPRSTLDTFLGKRSV